MRLGSKLVFALLFLLLAAGCRNFARSFDTRATAGADDAGVSDGLGDDANELDDSESDAGLPTREGE